MRIRTENNISDELALQLVLKVVQQGRISRGRNNKACYCFATVLSVPEDPGYEYIVWSNGQTKEDCFLVYKVKKNGNRDIQ